MCKGWAFIACLERKDGLNENHWRSKASYRKPLKNSFTLWTESRFCKFGWRNERISDMYWDRSANKTWASRLCMCMYLCGICMCMYYCMVCVCVCKVYICLYVWWFLLVCVMCMCVCMCVWYVVLCMYVCVCVTASGGLRTTDLCERVDLPRKWHPWNRYSFNTTVLSQMEEKIYWPILFGILCFWTYFSVGVGQLGICVCFRSWQMNQRLSVFSSRVILWGWSPLEPAHKPRKRWKTITVGFK